MSPDAVRPGALTAGEGGQEGGPGEILGEPGLGWTRGLPPVPCGFCALAMSAERLLPLLILTLCALGCVDWFALFCASARVRGCGQWADGGRPCEPWITAAQLFRQ